MKFFPYEKIRPVQSEFIKEVEDAISNGRNLIVHAPTGIGKTAGVISPSIEYILNSNFSIIFLTPRHTQHQIVIETLEKIGRKFRLKIPVADFIGKMWMCLLPGVTKLSSREFAELCRDLKKDERCPFYNNVRKNGELTKKAKDTIKEIKNKIMHVEEVCSLCKKRELCPYEITCEVAKESKVIIADYYHIFYPSIRNSFLVKTKKELSECILIIDEAHNLPDRIRKILSSSITTNSLKRGIIEARKFGFVEQSNDISIMLDILNELNNGKEERYVRREEFTDKLEKRTGKKIEEIYEELSSIGGEIRKKKKKSYCGSISNFLELWEGDDEGYTRIFKKIEGKFGDVYVLSYSCLDPSISSSEVFEHVHSSILMSGTLLPTKMYKEILGVSKCICKEYPSPFPKENRLVLIVPETTTKYSKRNELQFKRIAEKCLSIAKCCKGNIAIFFPSYEVRDSVLRYFKCEKKIFIEKQGMSKGERIELFHSFKECSKEGGILLGVCGGSFGEGLDYSHGTLNCVIIAGVPLQKPDLYTRALIEFYEKRFGAGWNYGYIFPSLNRAIQASGRPIRSENDKGVIVLLDERFIWKNYIQCIPKDWKIRITKNPEMHIKNFLNSHEQS